MELSPCLKQRNAVELDKPLDLVKLPSAEAKIATYGHWTQPDLAGRFISERVRCGELLA